MTSPKCPEEGLVFPLDWRGRVMARSDADDLPADIENALKGVGIEAVAEKNRLSAKGTYTSYTVTAVISSRDMLHKATYVISELDGVRMVL